MGLPERLSLLFFCPPLLLMLWQQVFECTARGRKQRRTRVVWSFLSEFLKPWLEGKNRRKEEGPLRGASTFFPRLLLLFLVYLKVLSLFYFRCTDSRTLQSTIFSSFQRLLAFQSANLAFSLSLSVSLFGRSHPPLLSSPSSSAFFSSLRLFEVSFSSFRSRLCSSLLPAHAMSLPASGAAGGGGAGEPEGEVYGEISPIPLSEVEMLKLILTPYEGQIVQHDALGYDRKIISRARVYVHPKQAQPSLPIHSALLVYCRFSIHQEEKPSKQISLPTVPEDGRVQTRLFGTGSLLLAESAVFYVTRSRESKRRVLHQESRTEGRGLVSWRVSICREQERKEKKTGRTRRERARRVPKSGGQRVRARLRVTKLQACSSLSLC